MLYTHLNWVHSVSDYTKDVKSRENGLCKVDL